MSKDRSSPRVALMVDHPQRDLPGLVLVACRLAQEGITSYLVPINLSYEVFHLVPDFVLLQYLRTNNEDLARKLLSAGIQVGVLDTEGSVFSPVPTAAVTSLTDLQSPGSVTSPEREYSLTMARDHSVRRRVALYCAWTPSFGQFVISMGWYAPEQVVVTGTPRIDFYNYEWVQAAKAASTYADGYSPLILILGSFPLANPRFNTPSDELDLMVDLFSYDQDYLNRWQENQETNKTLLVSLAKNIAAEFPHAQVVFRPHPFENEETYRDLRNNASNLTVVSRGTVDGWIIRADALVHWGSSASVEAAIADVPAFMPSWFPQHLPIPLVEEASISTASEDELFQRLSQVVDGSFEIDESTRRRQARAIRQAFFMPDGRAHERVAQKLSERLPKDRPSGDVRECRRILNRPFVSNVSIKRQILWALRRILGPSITWRLRRLLNVPAPTNQWDSSAKHYDLSEVKCLVNAIYSASGSAGFNAVRVSKASNRVDYRIAHPAGRTIKIEPL